MAASTIGWVASAFITKLVDKACSYAGDQHEYQREDTKEKLRSLKESLLIIQEVVQKAERLQTNSTYMANWLRGIKDAAYQAEDVLDIFDYRVLEEQAKVPGKVTTNSDSSVTAGSSSSSITTSSTTRSSDSTVKRSVCALKRFLFSDEDLNELTAVVNKFIKIDSQIQTRLNLVLVANKFIEIDSQIQTRMDFVLESSKSEQRVQSRATTSMPGSTKFFGRVNEEKQLKNLLVQTNEESSQPCSVISVTGIAGVGKTALVQEVYNHFHDTEKLFDFTAWLHVSDKFDVGHLTKEIVKSCSISTDLNNISSLDQVQRILQRILQHKLNGSRILVVLDDVWSTMDCEWEKLLKPLRYASNGSKVIVTTRSQKVANTNRSTEIMHLDGLEDEYYWKHFSQCAFGDANPSDFPQLEMIGRQLVKNLAGSPLAAKTVGNSLKTSQIARAIF